MLLIGRCNGAWGLFVIIWVWFPSLSNCLLSSIFFIKFKPPGKSTSYEAIYKPTFLSCKPIPSWIYSWKKNIFQFALRNYNKAWKLDSEPFSVCINTLALQLMASGWSVLLALIHTGRVYLIKRMNAGSNILQYVSKSMDVHYEKIFLTEFCWAPVSTALITCFALLCRVLSWSRQLIKDSSIGQQS